MRQTQCVTVFVVSTIVWIIFVNYFILPRSGEAELDKKLVDELYELEMSVSKYKEDSEHLIRDLQRAIGNNTDETRRTEPSKIDQPGQPSSFPALDLQISHAVDAIAVLVMACNRITVARCLDKLVKYRPSKERFPIIVSQDCVHERTSNTIDAYKNEIYHIHQPDQSDVSVPPKEKKFKGYFKIARHYKWALNVTFNHFRFDNVIIIEDDLDVSPDFYEYFAATLPVLRADPTLWCVSAWNDNGKSQLVDKNALDLLYRTDFYPGLGWMLTKTLWNELMPKWPKSYWDDWMRDPAQRRGRSCIRPELSRTKTFGKIGVSNGLFYDKYLKYIYLNDRFVKFTNKNLSYLTKDKYDGDFLKMVYGSPIVSYRELREDKVVVNGPVRILYENRATLKKMTKVFGLMDDLKSGVPRTAYLGIVSFVYRNRRVFFTPSSTFTGYDTML